MKTILFWNFVYSKGGNVIYRTTQPAPDKAAAVNAAHDWGKTMSFDDVSIFPYMPAKIYS